MRFQDVARELGEDEDTKRERLVKTTTSCFQSTVKDADTAEYCAAIALEVLLERIALMLDGEEDVGDGDDAGDDRVVRDDGEVAGNEDQAHVPLEARSTAEMITAAEEGAYLLSSDRAEQLAQSVVEETLLDAGFDAQASFAVATAFEASSIVQQAARLLVMAYAQHLRHPVFKQGQPCYVYQFEHEEYFPGHVMDVLGDDKYRVQLDGFHTVDVSVEAMSRTTTGDDDDEDAGEGACELCLCTTRRLTRHHLIPKLMHNAYRRRGFTRAELAQTTSICRPCHNAVHRAEPHASLAANYNTAEKLREHPEIAKWVEFAATQRKGGRWDHAVMVSDTQYAKAKRRMKAQ